MAKFEIAKEEYLSGVVLSAGAGAKAKPVKVKLAKSKKSKEQEVQKVQKAQEVQEVHKAQDVQEVHEVQEARKAGTRRSKRSIEQKAVDMLDAVKRELAGSQGVKGRSLLRINMGFTKENYEYIVRRSRWEGLTMTQFVNWVIAKDMEEQAKRKGRQDGN